MGRNPIVFFGKPKTVKKQTVSYRQLFISESGKNMPDTLYGHLYARWSVQRPTNLFDFSFQETSTRDRLVWNGWLSIFVGTFSFLLVIFLFSITPTEKRTLEDTFMLNTGLVVSSIWIGISLGIIIFCQPFWVFRQEVNRFVDAIVPLLWAMVEYREKRTFVDTPIEEMNKLLILNREWPGVVDGALVGLAFKVRMLEQEKPDGDLDLLEARQRFQKVHSTAVLFELAEKNPRTYYDRAKPVAPLAPATV